MKVMVVGGMGMLGQKIVNVIRAETDWQVSSVVRAGIADSGGAVYFDTASRKEWKELVGQERWRPDVIINAAAMTDVDRCEIDRERAWMTNVRLVETLTELCRKIDSRLVQVSTDYVFNGLNGPYSETDTPQPINYYGKTKLAAENVCTRSGVECSIIRTMWLYGDAEGGKRTFVDWAIDKLSQYQLIHVVTDEIGTPTLTDDVAYGIVRAIESSFAGIMNVAGDERMSRYDFAKLVASVYGWNKDLVRTTTTDQLDRPAARPLNSGLITLKAQTTLGLKLSRAEEGLRTYRVQRDRRLSGISGPARRFR
jgi:dTDP-4-dehydrorhamnose reductase